MHRSDEVETAYIFRVFVEHAEPRMTDAAASEQLPALRHDADTYKGFVQLDASTPTGHYRRLVIETMELAATTPVFRWLPSENHGVPDPPGHTRARRDRELGDPTLAAAPRHQGRQRVHGGRPQTAGAVDPAARPGALREDVPWSTDSSHRNFTYYVSGLGQLSSSLGRSPSRTPSWNPRWRFKTANDTTGFLWSTPPRGAGYKF